ncbi:WD40 repeat-like protein, partial [Pluteus cervinus]
VQIIHPSLADFLLDPQSGIFHIKLNTVQQFLAQQCMLVLSEQLKFNICHLETSYRRNSDVHDMEIRIVNNVSPELQYCCLYWIQHLIQCDTSAAVQFESSSSFASIFVNFKTFVHLSQTHAYEVYCFISKFYIPISTSTPHLYISALAFSPHNSLIYKTCSPSFPKRILLKSPLDKYWRADSVILSGNTNAISLVFNPFTNVIYSISSKKVLHLWNPYSGQRLEHCVVGHNSDISALALKCKENILISGSSDCTIQFWDLNTYKSMFQPLSQHNGQVHSLLLSKDQKTLFSASITQIISWDVSQGVPSIIYMQQPLQKIMCLCLTQNDQYLVSGGLSQVVIWNALTGARLSEFENSNFDKITAIGCSVVYNRVICGHLRGWILAWDLTDRRLITAQQIGTYHIVGVRLTKDERHFIVASAARAIHIFNTETLLPICDPLISRDEWINDIALSEDEHFLAATLKNASIQVWDFGALLQEAHRLSIQGVVALSCTSDGQYIIAGKSTGSMAIWNMQASRLQFKDIQGHTKSIQQIVVCCQNKQLISRADDRTLRIWDLD